MNLKQIITSASLYTILGLLPALSRVLLLPLFLVYMPVEEFGLISLNNLLTSIFPVFMTMSLEHSLARYYFDYRGKKNLVETYLSTILLLVMGVSCLICLLVWPLGDGLFDLTFKTGRFTFEGFGLLVLLQSGFFSLISILNAYFRTAQMLKTFAAFSLSQLILSTVAEATAILYYDADAHLVVLVKTWATGIVTGIFLLYIFFKTGIRFDKRFLPSSINYALPVIPYVLFGIIFSSVDRIIIENYLTLTALAVFNLAASIANLTDLYILAIQNATYPMIYDLFKKGYKANAAAINAIYKLKGSMILFGAGGLCMISYPLIHFFLVEEYRAAIPLIPVILAGFMLRFYYIAYSEPVFFFKQTRRLPALNFMLGVVSISFNLVMIPAMGLMGAALSSFIARGAQLFPTLSLYRKISDFRFDLGNYHVYSTLVLISLVLAGMLLRYGNYPVTWMMIVFCVPFVISVFALLYVNRKSA